LLLQKKWPPTRLRDFASERYDASLWQASTMALAWYVSTAGS
jgi:hypothetical protein